MTDNVRAAPSEVVPNDVERGFGDELSIIRRDDFGRAGIARLVEQLFQIVDIVSDDCEDAGEKLDGNDPVLRLPV